jgi:hypothetical protein
MYKGTRRFAKCFRGLFFSRRARILKKKATIFSCGMIGGGYRSEISPLSYLFYTKFFIHANIILPMINIRWMLYIPPSSYLRCLRLLRQYASEIFYRNAEGRDWYITRTFVGCPARGGCRGTSACSLQAAGCVRNFYVAEYSVGHKYAVRGKRIAAQITKPNIKRIKIFEPNK